MYSFFLTNNQYTYGFNRSKLIHKNIVIRLDSEEVTDS